MQDRNETPETPETPDAENPLVWLFDSLTEAAANQRKAMEQEEEERKAAESLMEMVSIVREAAQAMVTALVNDGFTPEQARAIAAKVMSV